MSSPAALYADLAEYYDQFCAEVNYAEQSACSRRVFALFASSGGSEYLDLACGTGQHLLAMQTHGFALHGLDNSEAMLQQAAQHCASATLLLSDMAELAQNEAYDLITCFLYSLHYSHPTSAVQQTLQRCFMALKPGGVLLFNAVDARGIENDAGITTQLQTLDATLRFQSAWHYAGKGEVLNLHLCITRDTAQGTQQWRDHHTMTALTLPQLEALLLGIGFDVQLLEHDYNVLLPWNGKSHNALVVATKAC